MTQTAIDDLVALAADWYWEQDAMLRFTRLAVASPAAPYNLQPYLGRLRRELPDARALTMTWEEHDAVLAARQPFHDFQYAFTFEARTRYVSVSGEPRFDAAGVFRGYRGTARDVSNLWLQRGQLEDARALLGVAAVLGHFGAWWMDTETRSFRWTELAQPNALLPVQGQGHMEQVLATYAPGHREQLQQAMQRCIADGTPFDLELQTLTQSGERMWKRVIGVAARDTDGRIVRLQGAFQDIQASKAAAEQHRELAQRLRVTLDSLTDGFGVLDRDWRITYVNPAALAMLRRDEAELVGHIFWDAFPGTRGSIFEDNYVTAMERGEVRRFEAFYPPMGIWFRASAFPSGQGIAISFTDITAAVEARQRLLEANEELERRVQERTEQLKRLNDELASFTVAVAHDLRAPLAGISGFSRAATERLAGHPDPKVPHYLSRVEAGVARMDDLLQGLLELSRIGSAEILPQAVDLSALAQDAIDNLRASAPERQVTASVQPGLATQGDARLLRTLLENLLGNAWKFSAPRALARIAVGRDADGAFFVQDNGAGFDPARAQELFAPFRRLHGDEEFRGIGIGLASARRVVERHGGRIWAESQPGVGSVFRFSLPTSSADAVRASVD